MLTARRITVSLDLFEDDARAFLETLNADGGLRELATERLLQQHTAEAIAHRTRMVAVLGSISKAISESLAA